MDQILGQFFVTQKIVESFFFECGVCLRMSFVVDTEVDELHQDAFLDDGNVFRRKHVRSEIENFSVSFFETKLPGKQTYYITKLTRYWNVIC